MVYHVPEDIVVVEEGVEEVNEVLQYNTYSRDSSSGSSDSDSYCKETSIHRQRHF